MTAFPDLFAALAAPFEPSELKSRPQGGKQLTYVTARTVMNRLDNVLGPENWWNVCTPHAHSVQVALTVRLPDGTTITKVDAGGYAGMADRGDDDMSGYSTGLKRAAALFGVARYLYRDGVPAFEAAAARDAAGPSDDRRAPRTGRELFGWIKDQEDAIGLMKYLTGWARLQDCPGRMVDYNSQQVALVYEEGRRRLAALRAESDEARAEVLSS